MKILLGEYHLLQENDDLYKKLWPSLAGENYDTYLHKGNIFLDILRDIAVYCPSDTVIGMTKINVQYVLIK